MWFRTFLAEPIYNLLVGLYVLFPWQDMGVAIILLTIIIKAVLWPLTGKALKSQKMLQELQPKVDEVKKKFVGDKEGMAREMMALYKAEKVNPASSCLPILIQLPVLIALYRVLLVGVSNQNIYSLYSFIPDPGVINEMAFGFLDLSQKNLVLAVLAGIAQYFQAKMMQVRRVPKAVEGAKGAKDEEMMAAMNKSMLYMMPAMTVVIGATLPAGLALYWLVVTLLSILQQWFVFRKTSG